MYLVICLMVEEQSEQWKLDHELNPACYLKISNPEARIVLFFSINCIINLQWKFVEISKYLGIPLEKLFQKEV